MLPIRLSDYRAVGLAIESQLFGLPLLVSKTTDIPKKALCLTDLHCTNTVPHCKGH